MSASPPLATPAANTKRPLDEESSPSGPTDQPDAKRPALDKPLKEETAEAEESKVDQQPAGEDAPQPSLEVVQAENDAAALQNGHLTNPVEPPVDGATTAQDTEDNPTETQPIQSTGNQYDRASSQGPAQHGHQDETGWLHMRAVISSAEAATVIGKGGENVSLIRRHSGAKCTVSDYSRGAVERVLTVSGPVDCAAKVCPSWRSVRIPTYLLRLLDSSSEL